MRGECAIKETSNRFADFIKTNGEAIRRLVNANTPTNSEGIAVITKDDPWRAETEWDDFCIELQEQHESQNERKEIKK